MICCPSEECLENFLEDQLDGHELSEVISHVESCESCQSALEALTSFKFSLAGTVRDSLVRAVDAEATTNHGLGDVTATFTPSAFREANRGLCRTDDAAEPASRAADSG